MGDFLNGKFIILTFNYLYLILECIFMFGTHIAITAAYLIYRFHDLNLEKQYR